METEKLSKEHKNILKVVEALENECASVKNKNEINKIFFAAVMDFIKNYADKFHHAKEENILFVEFLKKADKAPCNPIEQMLHEHNLGREFVKAMETGLGNNDAKAVAENGLRYAGLLREHIFKEDNVLYPMMDNVFEKNDQERISQKSLQVEKEKFEADFLEKYISFANSLGTGGGNDEAGCSFNCEKSLIEKKYE